MKTEEAIQKADGLGNLAEIFGISKSAICQWPENIPAAREYELRVKRPEWFQSAESGVVAFSNNVDGASGEPGKQH